MGGFGPALMLQNLGNAAGGGLMGGLGDFFRNNKNLLLQLLAAGGVDIATGSGGKNTLATITQAAGSQGMTKLLSGILKSGGKITTDGESTTIKMPTFAPGSTQTTEAGPEQIIGGQPATAPVPTSTAAPTQTSRLGSIYDRVNPFSLGLPEMSPSDLAGLAPENLIQAVGAGFTQEELNQRRVRDYVDALYKTGLLDYYQGQLASDEASRGISRVQAETGRMNAERQWLEFMTKDDRPPDIKEYEYAVGQGYEGTYEAWQNVATPETIKLYNAAKADGSWKGGGLWDFIKEKTSLGASKTTINLTPAERALSAASVEPRVQLKDSRGLTKLIDDKVKDYYERNFGFEFEPEATQSQQKARITVSTVEDLIRDGQGVVLPESNIKDGIATWVVLWPNGDKETIRRAIR